MDVLLFPSQLGRETSRFSWVTFVFPWDFRSQTPESIPLLYQRTNGAIKYLEDGYQFGFRCVQDHPRPCFTGDVIKYGLRGMSSHWVPLDHEMSVTRRVDRTFTRHYLPSLIVFGGGTFCFTMLFILCPKPLVFGVRTQNGDCDDEEHTNNKPVN